MMAQVAYIATLVSTNALLLQLSALAVMAATNTAQNLLYPGNF